MFKKLNPITPSQRNTKLLKKNHLNNHLINVPTNLIKGQYRAKGWNNQGKITVHHRGGGHKRLYRIISFKWENISGFVEHLEYDPNRSAYIALINNENKYKYILAPDGLHLNTYIDSGWNSNLKIGNSLPLYNLPIGSIIHNISDQPGKAGQYVWSAGTFAQLIQKIDNKYAVIRFPSKIKKKILLTCYATLGIVSNLNHKNIKLGKAGRSRWMDRRPSVWGVAKNPVDHPHGGGEGKTSGGRPSVSFTGKLTKGKPTRSKKNPINLL